MSNTITREEWIISNVLSNAIIICNSMFCSNTRDDSEGVSINLDNVVKEINTHISPEMLDTLQIVIQSIK